ncbi:hypothetical protein BC829DRAFT_441697 [Chytridium lagenaria]|nr:hypothetical protein BC829DRAFT_441697 [Chytridium lagenaria]
MLCNVVKLVKSLQTRLKVEASEMDVADQCNRALLSLGGGIGKPIEVLRVAGSSTTGTFGTCRMRIESVDGQSGITLSKGRIQAITRAYFLKCGMGQGSVVAVGGVRGGNVLDVGVSNSLKLGGGLLMEGCNIEMMDFGNIPVVKTDGDG